ncbi:Rossmann-like and DUF2520 domain-containing protein [Ferruginibacter albus]|uniref:Rossmann-like and DUF2520 domain-containing protein n=1 Tax=Ferruginibacter albus TaxID=2875540 RepID=UPI001CC7F852|nr:Rossmann-like and DUF2520 domain-containing protein [Ferruginibacter albus]UAY50767.1 DUF2520 domain-containing protein [Ferruginibacter albus]
MKVVLIGAGNVATVLGRKIKQAQHEVMQVYSRKIEHAQPLATELGCDATNTVESIYKHADVYLFAISDVALYDLKQFQFADKLVVHTGGAVSKEMLKAVSKNYGVLYPLQSLRKELTVIPPMPLLIDANSDEALEFLSAFAKTISDNVHETTDEQRLKLHVAAVVVNNFTNHLFSLAADYCKEEYLDFSLLFPLMDETVNRVHTYSPSQMQTGPAMRNDTLTLDKHLKLLADYPKLKYMYLKITESIIGR